MSNLPHEEGYRFVQNLRIVKRGPFYVDGERIDWYLADEDIEVTVGCRSRGNLSIVRLPVLAENVEVVDSTEDEP